MLYAAFLAFLCAYPAVWRVIDPKNVWMLLPESRLYLKYTTFVTIDHEVPTTSIILRHKFRKHVVGNMSEGYMKTLGTFGTRNLA